MMGFFDDLFDLNGDGKLDAFERMMEYAFLTEEIEDAGEPIELECSETCNNARKSPEGINPIT